MPVCAARLRRLIRLHATREEGSGTAMALILLVACLALAAFAIDLQRVNSLDIQLQNVADNAANAAILARSTQTEAQAKTAAVTIARANLPVASTGNVIVANDVEFGQWNAVSRTFSPVAGSTEAVRVTLRRTAANGNPIKMFLLQIAGIGQMSMTRRAVMVGYDPDCLREGFVAQGMVDIQSNNVFKAGFCIHSNSVVKVSSGNSFEAGVKVSMPDASLVQMPNSGFASSPGLQAALSSNRYDIRILSRIQTIINGLRAGSDNFVPKYITDKSVLYVTDNWFKNNTPVAGRIYDVNCAGGGKNSITVSGVLQKVVILTNCTVTFGSGSQMINSVIATTSTEVKSITGASNVTLGNVDACAAEGGAQLLTLGGISFSSGLSVYGVQLLAAGDIGFSASGTGVQGVSLVSGGTISGTSGMTMTYCNGAGMEQNFRMSYARLVM